MARNILLFNVYIVRQAGYVISRILFEDEMRKLGRKNSLSPASGIHQRLIRPVCLMPSAGSMLSSWTKVKPLHTSGAVNAFAPLR
jgi:hypothetical protein